MIVKFTSKNNQTFLICLHLLLIKKNIHLIVAWIYSTDGSTFSLIILYPFFSSYRITEEKPGWCNNPHLPPCAAYVEITDPGHLLEDLRFTSSITPRTPRTGGNKFTCIPKCAGLLRSWPLYFLGMHGVVFGIWFRYGLSFLSFLAVVTP